jgi:hypothetical protein
MELSEEYFATVKVAALAIGGTAQEANMIALTIERRTVVDKQTQQKNCPNYGHFRNR